MGQFLAFLLPAAVDPSVFRRGHELNTLYWK